MKKIIQHVIENNKRRMRIPMQCSVGKVPQNRGNKDLYAKILEEHPYIVQNITSAATEERVVAREASAAGALMTAVSAGGDVKEEAKFGITDMWGCIEGSGEETRGEPAYLGAYLFRQPRAFVMLAVDLREAAALGVITKCVLELTCSYRNADNIVTSSSGAYLEVVDNDGRLNINLNGIVAQAQNGSVELQMETHEYGVFVIESNYAVNPANQPALIIEYIPNDEILQGQKYVECNAGMTACNIDVLTGMANISRNLVRLGGEMAPLNVSLVFDSADPLGNTLKGMATGLPKGCFINYHQYCFKDGVFYVYVDGGRKKHLFKLAENSMNLWFDSAGTGLLLKETPDGTKIFDECGNYYQFDTSGRLKKIYAETSLSAGVETQIAYNGGTAEIAAVTDGMGRTVVFSYGGGQTTISVSGSNKAKITSAGNNFLYGAVRLDGANEEADRFAINSSTGLITGISSYSGETLTLNYDAAGRVMSADGGPARKKYSMTYKFLQTDVRDEKNVVQTSLFNRDGELTTSYEAANPNATVRFVNREACKAYAAPRSKSVLWNPWFGGSPELNYYSVSMPQTALSEMWKAFYIYADRHKIFSAVAEASGCTFKAPDNDALCVEVINDLNEVLCKLEFDPYIQGRQIAAKPFRLKSSPGSNGVLRVRVRVNSLGGNYKISGVMLTELGGECTSLCSNADTGSEKFAKYFAPNEPLYFMDGNTGVTENGINYDYKLRTEDYLANERNYHKNAGINWNMWYNGKKGLRADVNNPVVRFGIAGISFSSARFTEVTENPETGVSQAVSLARRISHNRADFGTGYTAYYARQTEKSFTDAAYTKEIYCDSEYHALLIEDGNRTTVNTYSAEGFLTHSKTEAAGAAMENIIERQDYENGFLKRAYDYLCQNVSVSEYEYNGLGAVTKVKDPNLFETNTGYDGHGDRLIRVDGTISGAQNKN